jgi:hypothetical protein
VDIAMSETGLLANPTRRARRRRLAAMRNRRSVDTGNVVAFLSLLLGAVLLAAALVVARVAVYGHFQWGDPWLHAVPKERNP